jgi:hypothetical protein
MDENLIFSDANERSIKEAEEELVHELSLKEISGN